jgi:hypothetical protein
MTKGQRAMAVAVIYPEPAKGGRGKINAVKITEFDQSYISHARTILKHAPDLSDSVLSGSGPLNDAYKTALQRKKVAEKHRQIWPMVIGYFHWHQSFENPEMVLPGNL